jgi:hypothetical protein
MKELMPGGSTDEIFLRIEDKMPNNSLAGFIKSLMIEDLSPQLSVSSLNIPIPILDVTVGAEEVIILDYSFSPPQNVNATLDSLNGRVQLSWDAPGGAFTPIEYRVYLNGRLVDSTSSLLYTHFLSLRGTHSYAISALFQNDESLAAMTNVHWTGPAAYGIPWRLRYSVGYH